ncbi:MAG TPA: carboxypeptidase regulatory-like domain-containing protein, partial [Puia sp.]|nr:carboxypeptidase regulatory-like domain-containing protein [Puia sp.]
MRRLLIGLLCAVLSAQLAYAQSLSGIVKDSLTGVPVSFATAEIRSRGSDTVLRTTVTDGKGRFGFSRLSIADFEITLSCVGYTTKRVAVTTGANPVSLGILYLSPRTDMLKEVTVNGRKSLIEERLDRTVYNVENDLTILGGDATDALRRVPLLSVDIDGNVTLRGSSNIKILINGKPSTIT